MKKLIIATLLGGVGIASAQAQSNVTIYGTVDVGVVSERGGAAGSVSKVTSGVGSASRLGFKGNEDLGDGMSAVFVLEEGVLADTGAQDSAGQAFNRQSFVGLSSREYGALTLGRQKTVLYQALGEVGDPFALGYAGTVKNLFPLAGVNTRTSNTVAYNSPMVNGVSGEVTYSAGEQAGDASAGREIGAALAYTGAVFNARLVYSSRNSDTAAVTATATAAAIQAVSHDLGHTTLLVANYDFTLLRAYFSYSLDKGFNSAVLPNLTNPYGYAVAPKATTNSADLLIGATIPVSRSGTIMTSYVHKGDKQFGQNASQLGVGYSYALSKRTSTYLSYAHITNKNGAGYTVGNDTEAGSGNSALDIGVRHSF